MDLKTLNLKPYFFDHATCTPIFQSVKNVLIENIEIPFVENRPLYAADEKLQKETLAAIKTIRSFFSVEEKDFLRFTPSYGLAIEEIYCLHLEKVVKATGKNHIFYLEFDRKEIIFGLKELEKNGCIIEKIPLTKDGQIDFESFQKRINPKTSLITLSLVDPLAGVIQPVEELYEICQKKGIDLHLDVTEVMGKIYFRAYDLPVTYLSYDCGKMGGPNHFGVTVIRYQPALKEFSDQIFVGPKEYAKLLAFGVFCYEMMQLTEEFFFDLPQIKEEFESLLLEKIPEARILFSSIERVQSHSLVYFPKVHQEMMLYFLVKKEVYGGIGEKFHDWLQQKLLKMGVTLEIAQSTICFSFSFKTKRQSIVEACSLIQEAYSEAVKTCNQESEDVD